MNTLVANGKLQVLGAAEGKEREPTDKVTGMYRNFSARQLPVAIYSSEEKSDLAASKIITAILFEKSG